MSLIKQPIIGIVSPCFNEEENVKSTASKLTNLLSDLIQRNIISEKSILILVDDGSVDNTWNLINEQAHKNSKIKGLKLSKNFGHQNALLAGLFNFNNDVDALISIDADLQDDIQVIEEMIVKFKNGADTVYGIRNERKTDTFFKRTTAQLFYKLMLLMKVNLLYNHADFRLCSKRVIQSLEGYNETNLFLRGIIPSIGFKSDTVTYNRLDRSAGETKYTLGKMLSFAWDGITSFSSFPLKLVSTLGFLIFIFCIIMLFYALYALVIGSTVPGWLSTVLPMYFLGGIQLFCFGIIGEYVGKIYSEVKHRPRFIIEEKI
ncbi:glycosyltransferase family 2 protein [Polaribacter haliotis]|uniref:Glycosyltransferase family 2 protein n=1 Tax=Polaribacter haliotis TaxID=1888915 RepID=A0A7L8AHN0_9FLAO|nr:glycosyltransferase family 2 protein [Polaribacter haliotis]QOD61500.1 glycosyltransferase family 2 protein [Polaribacter haliotis]